MPSSKLLKERIESIQDTMKITNAMYLISSSKLRKARQNYQNVSPYFNRMRDTISRVVPHLPEEPEHPFFHERNLENPRRAYLVLTADKGMAGAYNHNIIKIAEEELANHPDSELYVVGQVGRHYFARKNVPVDIHFQYTAQNPSLHRARVIADKMLENYESGKIDEVYIIYTKMINSVTAEPEMIQLLPFRKMDFKISQADVYHEEIIIEPSPRAVMDRIVPNYITGFIYGALVESFCSEQNSRMMAMDSATRSAKDMLADLSIKYNRARQAAITQEITEVVGGAKALQNKK